MVKPFGVVWMEFHTFFLLFFHFHFFSRNDRRQI